MGWEKMKSVPAVLAGLAGGAALGLLHREAAAFVSRFGDLYLSFLMMCALPIMASALISGVARLLRSVGTGKVIGRIVGVFALAFLVVGIVSVSVGVVGRPGGGLTETTKDAFGSVLVEAMVDTAPEADGSGPFDFLWEMIPSNVFVAFVEGNTLQILFFSMVFGVVLALVPGETTDNMIDLVELVFKVFQDAIGWALYILPLALGAMMAGQVLEMGASMLVAMGKFAFFVYLVTFLLIALGSLVYARIGKKTVKEQFRGLKEPLLIAFGTRSNLAVMPSLIHALRDAFRVSPSIVNLVVPLGLLICRYSMVVVFTLSLCFMAQIYFIPISFLDAVLLCLGSITAAVATAGMPTLASLGAVAIVAVPLGIPFEPGVLLLAAASPIIDPVIAILDSFLNSLAATLIDTRTVKTLESTS